MSKEWWILGGGNRLTLENEISDELIYLDELLDDCRFFDIKVGEREHAFSVCFVSIRGEEKDQYGPEGFTGNTYTVETAYARTQDDIKIVLEEGALLCINREEHSRREQKKKELIERRHGLEEELRECERQLKELLI